MEGDAMTDAIGARFGAIDFDANLPPAVAGQIIFRLVS